MKKKKHKRQRSQKERRSRHRLVGGPHHGKFVKMDAHQPGVMMLTKPSRWASYYEKKPANKNELLFKRTAHFTEWDIPDYEWQRTSPDDCVKCGKPQLGCGSEFCFNLHGTEVCFRICRPCLRGLDSKELNELRDRLQDQAIQIAEKRVAEAN